MRTRKHRAQTPPVDQGRAPRDRHGMTEHAGTTSDRFCVGITLPPPPAGSQRPAVAAASARLKLDVFCRDLADALGSDAPGITTKTFATYSALLDAVAAKQVDLAWLPPRVAAQATSRDQVVPIAIPIRGEHAWYAAALFSAPNSRVRTLADLDGLRAAWVDPESMAGYLGIRAWLRSKGIDPTSAFKAESFLGSHERVVDAVLEGRFDVGATFAHPDPSDHQSILSAGWGDDIVHVVGVSGPIPADVLAARADMEPRVIDAVRSALTGDMTSALRGSALALFEADRFEAADESTRSSLVTLIDHLDGSGSS